MGDRVTLATATGLPFLALAVHVATGLVAMVAGFVAILARKGGTWHRRSGQVFVAAMITTGFMAVAVATYQGSGSVAGGVFLAYLVFTAWITVRPLRAVGRGVHIALMVVALAFAVGGYRNAFIALDLPGKQLDGAPAGMIFFLATIGLLAAIGDARMIRAGELQGTRRLARHLWRMCFGLFIAAGSFLLGQMKFIPEPIRIVPLLLVVSLSPLVFLLYWMWRVRFRAPGQRREAVPPILHESSSAAP